MAYDGRQYQVFVDRDNGGYRFTRTILYMTTDKLTINSSILNDAISGQTRRGLQLDL